MWKMHSIPRELSLSEMRAVKMMYTQSENILGQ